MPEGIQTSENMFVECSYFSLSGSSEGVGLRKCNFLFCSVILFM